MGDYAGHEEEEGLSKDVVCCSLQGEGREKR
jgi:hypothetical protein